MACERVPFKDYYFKDQCKETIKERVECANCIYDIVKKIIHQQKEAKLHTDLDTCESPLFAQIFNTRPVTLYLANGTPFTVPVPCTDKCTSVFRIEYLRGDCVTLRLLVRTGATYVCTEYTAVLNLCCVCGLQCFPPIMCDECINVV